MAAGFFSNFFHVRPRVTKLSQSIDYASRIQRSLLPTIDDLTRSFGATAAVWQPKDIVGGDFYWHRVIGDKHYLVVMDCTGHGVPGAFMTLIASAALERIAALSLATKALPPLASDLLEDLHSEICRQLHQFGGGSASNDGLDAIALVFSARGVEFCGARLDLFTLDEAQDNSGDNNGNNNGGGHVVRHRGAATSLGYYHDGNRLGLASQFLPHKPRMTYIITTDGFLTQIGAGMKHGFGNARFFAALAAMPTNDPCAITASLMADFRQWQGDEERRDDIALIAIRP